MTDLRLPKAPRRVKTRRRALAALGLGLALLAPGPARAAPLVQVRAPWFRYLLASLPAGGYLTIVNTGATPVVLTGATSPGCAMLMLHRTETTGGTDRMVGVRQVSIPAHGQVRFAPGGYHLMCMEPKMHLGQVVPLTLHFADGGTVTVRAPVHGANFAPAAAPKQP